MEQVKAVGVFLVGDSLEVGMQEGGRCCQQGVGMKDQHSWDPPGGNVKQHWPVLFCHEVEVAAVT